MCQAAAPVVCRPPHARPTRTRPVLSRATAPRRAALQWPGPRQLPVVWHCRHRGLHPNRARRLRRALHVQRRLHTQPGPGCCPSCLVPAASTGCTLDGLKACPAANPKAAGVFPCCARQLPQLCPRAGVSRRRQSSLSRRHPRLLRRGLKSFLRCRHTHRASCMQQKQQQQERQRQRQRQQRMQLQLSQHPHSNVFFLHDRVLCSEPLGCLYVLSCSVQGCTSAHPARPRKIEFPKHLPVSSAV